jgi:hypothetical protein
MSYEGDLQENYAGVRSRLMGFPRRQIRAVEAPPVRLPIPEIDTYVPHPLRWRTIISEVLEHHGLTYQALMSRQRSKLLTACRHECIYRLARETRMSHAEIGRKLGGLDHTSVLHAVKSYRQKLMVKSGQVLP